MKKYDINTLIKENKPTEEEKEKVSKLCFFFRRESKKSPEVVSESVENKPIIKSYFDRFRDLFDRAIETAGKRVKAPSFENTDEYTVKRIVSIMNDHNLKYSEKKTIISNLLNINKQSILG